MPDLLTDDDLATQHDAMLACEDCQRIQLATDALHDLLTTDLMLLTEWGDASQKIFYAQDRHWQQAHPRYSDHITAMVEQRKRETVDA